MSVAIIAYSSKYEDLLNYVNNFFALPIVCLVSIVLKNSSIFDVVRSKIMPIKTSWEPCYDGVSDGQPRTTLLFFQP